MYDWMVREIYRDIIWPPIYDQLKGAIELDFEDIVLISEDNLARMLFEASEDNFPGEEPFVVLATASLPPDGQHDENSRFVEYLNKEHDVRAELLTFDQVKKTGKGIVVRGFRPTVIFLDSNLDALLALGDEVDGLIAAIYEGLVVNPRGLEPLGDKALFSAVTGSLRDSLNPWTVEFTPETRLLTVEDVDWAWENRESLVFKPRDGHSGKGFCHGERVADKDAIREMAVTGGYIAQVLVDPRISEYELVMPETAPDDRRLRLNTVQTDYRLMITQTGLGGNFCRFSPQAPVNVGAGGGGQAMVGLISKYTPHEAMNMVNEALFSMGFGAVLGLFKKAMEAAFNKGLIYKDRAYPIGLTPRFITKDQMTALSYVALDLWDDLVILEEMWREGRLDDVVQVPDNQREIIQASPWEGGPAIVAADCLIHL